MRFKYIAPNLLTLSSLCFAFFSMLKTSEGAYTFAAWLLLISFVCDGFDGKVARLLNASSELGAEFDTLSDFVAFGIAPAFLVYKYALSNLGILGIAAVLIYITCGGFRLARFNLSNSVVETGTKQPFEGLPIPGAASLITTFILLNDKYWVESIKEGYLILIVLSGAFLMISKIEYPVKFCRDDNAMSINLLKILKVAILISLIKLPYITLFVVISSYVTYGFVRHFIQIYIDHIEKIKHEL